MNAISRPLAYAPKRAPDLRSYDRIVVAFSGGKDSVACLLTLLEAGIPQDRIDVYHHEVDGNGPSFMDWPCTTAYCRAVASALGVPLYLSWKDGGFLREMLHDGAPTAPICFETPEGRVGRVGGRGPAGTRLRFPQVSADLGQRCCSAYLKIDSATRGRTFACPSQTTGHGPAVPSAEPIGMGVGSNSVVQSCLIRNQDRFLDSRTLIVTGERAQESRAGAGYATFEPDRTDTRQGLRRRRHVDHWRPVHALREDGVWDILRRHGIVPAPAYRLGWSRLSCIAYIFGNADQWASLRYLAPEWFERIASYEDAFGRTIHRNWGIRILADRGRPYQALIAQPGLARRALDHAWDEPVLIRPIAWLMPAGAFGSSDGPS